MPGLHILSFKYLLGHFLGLSEYFIMIAFVSDSSKAQEMSFLDDGLSLVNNDLI
jgi:hypothetical protein